MIYPRAAWVEVISRDAGITRQAAMKVLRVVSEETKRKLSAGEDVRLFGIGRLAILEARARIGRDTKSGPAVLPVHIPARKRIKFYPLEALNKAARGGGEDA